MQRFPIDTNINLPDGKYIGTIINGKLVQAYPFPTFQPGDTFSGDSSYGDQQASKVQQIHAQLESLGGVHVSGRVIGLEFFPDAEIPPEVMP